MTSWLTRWCGILLAFLVCGGACGSSSASRSGSGGAGGGGGGAGGTDAPSDGTVDFPGDEGSSDASSETSACPVDGAVVTDPFAGVWTGVQGSETFTFTNNTGCSTWTGSVGATICDLCVGTYVQTDAGVASATQQCRPVGACSASAAHTDTGPYKLSGCSITYDYNFGSGSASFVATRVSDTTVDVCGQIDGGTD
ncbi:MAG: hypothetical protein QOI66_5097 [Myxococcales bacterium]|nr:hypothetical protein [Myxococcales bacterium]